MFYLGDCLEGMKQLDDKSIDLVVTSPPYNLDIQYSKYKDKKPKGEFVLVMSGKKLPKSFTDKS